MLPSEIGERAEAAVLAALVDAGKHVLLPFGEQHRYDLAWEEDGRLVKVQVKAGSIRKGAICFRTHSVGRSSIRDYRDDVDFFGVYCHSQRAVYLVPVGHVPLRGASLRVSPPKNGQRSGIRSAAQYLLLPSTSRPRGRRRADSLVPSDQLILTDIDVCASIPSVETKTRELPVLCCGPLAAPALAEDEARATAEIFKALADPHRVKIVNLLAHAGGPVCVCDINAAIGLSQPTISFHLKKLASVGLVTREQRGTWAYYSLDPVAMRKLAGVVEMKGT